MLDWLTAAYRRWRGGTSSPAGTSGSAPRASRSGWSELAWELGLHCEPGGEEVHGVLEGWPVTMKLESLGTGEEQTSYTMIRAPLRPPLDLGLSIVAHFGQASWSPAGGEADDLDLGLVVRADEPARATALVQPDLRAELRALRAAGVPVELTDWGVSVRRQDLCLDRQWLSNALSAAARLARRLDEARHRIPAATRLRAHRDGWRAFAKARGLRCDDTPLRLSGTIDGVAVEARIDRSGPLSFVLRIEASFSAPLGCGLVLEPARKVRPWDALMGAEAPGTGFERVEPSFDLHFEARSEVPGMIERILDPEAQRELVALERAGVVARSTDTTFALETFSLADDPQSGPALIERAARLALHLWENAQRQPEAAGPYR